MPSKTITAPSRGDETTTPRARAFAGIPAAERRLELAGDLHRPAGRRRRPADRRPAWPGANASHWARVIPALTTSNRVVAPDLPGQGASTVDGDLTRDRVIDWLDELIEQTCAAPRPWSVTRSAAGSRRATRSSGRTGAGSSCWSTPWASARSSRPSVRARAERIRSRPDGGTHDGLWARCAHDLPSLRARMGRAWNAMAAYDLDRAPTPSVQKALGVLMERVRAPAIPSADLAGIQVPTTLIWGRHDEATPLDAAQQVAERTTAGPSRSSRTARTIRRSSSEAFVRALRRSSKRRSAMTTTLDTAVTPEAVEELRCAVAAPSSFPESRATTRLPSLERDGRQPPAHVVRAHRRRRRGRDRPLRARAWAFRWRFAVAGTTSAAPRSSRVD